MSMTKEEAITNLEKLAALFYTESEQSKMVDYSKIIETFEFSAAALRPITREQVEKMRGEWIDRRALSDAPVECSNCGEWVYGKLQDANFCPFCGVPMTDEAVDMVMERLEAMKDGNSVKR